MSYLLDALNKAEQAKTKSKTTNIGSGTTHTQDTRYSKMDSAVCVGSGPD